MDSNWVMVIITGVYVLFTIGICVANGISAYATHKQLKQTKTQLEESEFQFLETQRLACMPFLQLEKEENTHNGSFFIALFPDCFHSDTNTYEFEEGEDNYFWLRNIGNGAAANLSCIWTCENRKPELTVFPTNGLMHRDKYPIILFVDSTKKVEGTLEWIYTDIIGNEYTQKVYLCFENGEVTKLENDIPKYG